MPTQRLYSARRLAAAFVALAIALGAAAPASAETITFDFNSLSDGNSGSNQSGGNNAAIQTYMNGVLSGLGLPTGLVVYGAKADKNYTGDNHVVGACTPAPCSAGDSIRSLTLGTSDGTTYHDGLDAYIYNHDSVKFTMTFPFPVYGVSFDYEIFPNASCGNPNGNYPTPSSGCGTPPDFTFKADGAQLLYKLAVDPYVTPINGYQNSPISGGGSKELAAQWIGMSGWIDILGGATFLEFYDWPERVGIDNLIIERSREQDIVPEPGTLLLFGAAAAGFFTRRKKLL